jgi:hypothetical protein
VTADRTVTADGMEAAIAQGRHFGETSETATAGALTEAGATAAIVGATIVGLLQAQGLAQATAAHPRPRQDRPPKPASRSRLTKRSLRTW